MCTSHVKMEMGKCVGKEVSHRLTGFGGQHADDLTSQAELGDGICFILDGAHLEAPAKQSQRKHLPHLP